MPTHLDIRKIMNLLPHRYPFLLVDRILEISADDKIVGLKNVTMNEPFFQGHFPTEPVMPGVLIVESMAQVGGVLVFSLLPPEQRGQAIFFMGMDRVRFRKPVVPGDQMIVEVRLLKRRARAVKMSASASVDGALVAEAELLASFGEKT